eukprot:scaffold21566_cov73-Cyclotella_meneghiniana.AAC.10
MPLKVTKDMTSHLIKYVRTVDINFNPFDKRTRSAREVLRQIDIQRFYDVNPKLKVNPNILSTPDAPTIKFSFVDGTDKTFNSSEHLADEILIDVWRGLMKMDDDWEMEGKNVDDI